MKVWNNTQYLGKLYSLNFNDCIINNDKALSSLTFKHIFKIHCIYEKPFTEQEN